MKAFTVSTGLLLLFLLAASPSDAQLLTPFTFEQGIEPAQTKARDTLQDDGAYLVYGGAPGDFAQSGLEFSFDLSEGTSEGWLYLFYSPKNSQTALIGVIKPVIFDFQAFTFPQNEAIPIPENLVNEIDKSGSHFDSDEMVIRLETDTAYQNFREDLPGARPKFLTVGEYIENDTISPPNGFPLDEALWTLVFRGQEDSTMICVVATESGDAFCRRIYGGISSVGAPRTIVADGALRTLPTPARGSARIVVDLPAEKRPHGTCRMILSDLQGRTVLDLTQNFAANNYEAALFDASALPSGTYFCRIQGEGWQGLAGRVVVGP